MNKREKEGHFLASYAMIIIITVVIIITAIVWLVVIKNKQTDTVYYGRIKTYFTVVNNASVNYLDSYQVEIADMFYRDDIIIEKVENEDGSPVDFIVINDNKYLKGQDLESLSLMNIGDGISVYEKKIGGLFLNEPIPDYDNRINFSDTVLNNQYLKRFYIKTEYDFSVFYVDTVLNYLPYNLNTKVKEDYNGSLVRIDTYQDNIDRFSTLLLTHTDTIPPNIYTHLNRLYDERKQAY